MGMGLRIREDRGGTDNMTKTEMQNKIDKLIDEVGIQVDRAWKAERRVERLEYTLNRIRTAIDDHLYCEENR